MFPLLLYQRNMEFWRDLRNIWLMPMNEISALLPEAKSPEKQPTKDEQAKGKKRK
ncbi:hypothetical protein HS961_10450 [Comamonas piscis]|uniref:Uncharacterized protein n=1 Tax=Comamonas piscis TaxID=1562974 RepID=A0A7G5EGT9_9BURK|nr:hypothetical protein [Comamonas piscis]QMV73214.1 hypothetical protein HS961_10450 [Comamonas piscis]WSO36006.1 hypothetical protein VUJ63_10485 [Comamonas piscis]